MRLYRQWEDYKSFLEGPIQFSVVPLTIQHHGRGRPKFQVSKSQVEYLASLSFKWTEIASILGISRIGLFIGMGMVINDDLLFAICKL